VQSEKLKFQLKRKRIISAPIWIVSLVSLFTDVASEMLYPVMPVYLKSIGFTVALIGVLEGLVEAVAGVSKGYFGNLSDKKHSRVPFIRAGYALSAISKPLLSVAIHPAWVFLCRTVDRLGKGIRTSARDAYLSDLTTKEHKGRVFGFHRSLDTVGAAIGPVIALLFLAAFPGNYRWLFLVAFLPGVFAIGLTLFLKEKKKVKENGAKKRVSFFAYLQYWKRSPVQFRWLVGGLLAFVLFNSSDVFLLLFLKEKGYSDTAMIGFYIFYNLMYALFSYPLGILSDKIGQKTLIAAGFILFSIVYFTFGFAGSTLIFGLLFLVYGLYAAATEGISKALLTNMVQKEDTATALGFFNSFASIATLAASSIGGLIWYAFSPQHMFVFSGVGVMVTVIFLIIVFNKTNFFP
jgi:MFS family permease